MYRVVVGNTQPGHLNSKTKRATIFPKHIVPRYSVRRDDLPAKTHPRRLRVGVRDVLVYCRDHRCHIMISADRWPDDVRLPDIEPDFGCTSCGKRGAEVRPKFSQGRMGA